jgi:GDP-L-fucose synthase
LIRKVHEASKTDGPVCVWGTGSPRREFMHVDDCADACIFLMQHYSNAAHINIGAGDDIPIIELTRLVMEVIGYRGEIITDPAKPDGTPRKLMDSSRLTALGWQPRISLREGIATAYAAFLAGDGRGL